MSRGKTGSGEHLQNNDLASDCGVLIVGRYDPSKPKEGSVKEQQAINRAGGLESLDNKRNEIRREDWGKSGVE